MRASKGQSELERDWESASWKGERSPDCLRFGTEFEHLDNAGVAYTLLTMAQGARLVEVARGATGVRAEFPDVERAAWNALSAPRMKWRPAIAFVLDDRGRGLLRSSANGAPTLAR